MKKPRSNVTASIDPEMMARIDQFAAVNGLTRATVLRMAIDRFMLGADSDPWALSYLEGMRVGHEDLRQLMIGLLTQLQNANLAARQYAEQVRADAVARRIA